MGSCDTCAMHHEHNGSTRAISDVHCWTEYGCLQFDHVSLLIKNCLPRSTDHMCRSSFWYNYGGSASNFVVKTMSVDCQRSVRARYTYTRSVRVYSYGEPTASYTVETEVLSYLNFTATNTYSMTSGVYEESTASVMECTGRWNPDQGYALNYHTAIHTTDETCRYYEVCDDGRADVTIAGDLAGLTSRATTTNSSSTRTPAPSMVTKTMSQTSEVTTGTIPITTAPPPASTSATAAP